MHFGGTYASLSNQNISFITAPNCKNICIQVALFIHSVTFNSFCTICSELFSIKRSAFEFATAVKNLSLNFTYKPIYFACIDNNQYKITSNGGALNCIETAYRCYQIYDNQILAFKMFCYIFAPSEFEQGLSPF